MIPIYYGKIFPAGAVASHWSMIPWVRVAPRDECWMNDLGLEYTYGSGRGIRTYTPTSFNTLGSEILHTVNAVIHSDLDVCFINGYRDGKDSLDWHADDSPEVSNEHPIAVVSFGAEREIWVKKMGDKGVVPDENRFLLEDGSLFVMPPGFQLTHQHKIPKHHTECGPRISFTFRKYKKLS